MKATKAFAYRNWKHQIGQKMQLFMEFTVFPLLLVVSMGLMVTSLSDDPAKIGYVLAATIVWKVMNTFQHSVSMGFMEEFWHETYRQTFTLPFKLRSIIIGSSVYGLVSAGITMFTTLALSWLLFNFPYHPLSLVGLTAILLMFWGGIIATLSIALIFWKGDSGMKAAWVLTDVVVLLSGVYYNLNILPDVMRVFALTLPSTHLFHMLKLQAIVPENMVAVIILLLAWGVLARQLTKITYKIAKAEGRLVKFW